MLQTLGGKDIEVFLDELFSVPNAVSEKENPLAEEAIPKNRNILSKKWYSVYCKRRRSYEWWRKENMWIRDILFFLRTLLMFVQRHFWGMKIVLFKYNCFNILSLMGADNLTVGKAFLKNKHRTTNKPLMFVLKRNQMCIVMLYCIISPLWRIKENSRIYWK